MSSASLFDQAAACHWCLGGAPSEGTNGPIDLQFARIVSGTLKVCQGCSSSEWMSESQVKSLKLGEWKARSFEVLAFIISLFLLSHHFFVQITNPPAALSAFYTDNAPAPGWPRHDLWSRWSCVNSTRNYAINGFFDPFASDLFHHRFEVAEKIALGFPFQHPSKGCLMTKLWLHVTDLYIIDLRIRGNDERWVFADGRARVCGPACWSFATVMWRPYEKCSMETTHTIWYVSGAHICIKQRTEY